jgi:acyl carrier protein
VLACANRVAGTTLVLTGDGDLPLEAFGFDSLSLLAFLLEVEDACGVDLDEALLGVENLTTIRSVARVIAGTAGR